MNVLLVLNPLTLLIYVAVIVIIVVAFFWLLGQVPDSALPGPTRKILTIVLVIIVVIVAIYLLLGLAGGGLPRLE